jgi:hypothetical protein
MSINIESLTVKELREVASLAHALSGHPSSTPGVDVFPFKPGDIVLVMTVTMWFVGKLSARDASWIVLDEASWMADSGRFNEAFEKGDAKENEPLPLGPFPIPVSAIIGVKAFKTTLRLVK